MKKALKERRLKFTLRSLLLIVAVLTVLSGWATNFYFRMQAEDAYHKHAERRMGALKPKRSNGRLDDMVFVKYDYQYDSQGRFNENATPPGPAWLRRIAGNNIFASIVSLGLYADEFDQFYEHSVYFHVDPDILDGIENLSRLTKLGVYVENLPSPLNLEQLQLLEELNLRTGKNNPVDLIDLSRIPNLKRAKIEGPTISTAETESGQSKLKILELKENHSIADLTGIRFARNLVELKIWNCNGLRSLKGIENLESLEKLSLTVCNSLESLEGIESASELQWLYLSGSNVESLDRAFLPSGIELDFGSEPIR